MDNTPVFVRSATDSPEITSDGIDSRRVVGLELANLRGVLWRVYLGILPSSPDSSIEDFRRVTADSRRKYASLRRRHLVDPHLPKDIGGRRSPELVIDNPLSQNPDSMWGRFFRNAELEKMLDQDLSRLYPEHGDYFQTTACQAMLRKILLLWCLKHPEYGYRQGMHELLAPLLYVLRIDIQHLAEVRKTYEDHFTDEFDGKSFSETDQVASSSSYRFTKNSNMHGDDAADDDNSAGETSRISGLDELDSVTRNVILLSDAYGAEGELGVVLSERFMEHDAYCLFDALMNGSNGGGVAMANFFSTSPAPVIKGFNSSVLPVIEAANAVYYLLSNVDSVLHSHLVELEVEPQYFYLRWLRVLFGREFTLDNLLVIWDEVFSSQNTSIHLDTDINFKILSSARGRFISAMAVSMILHMRSSLLATEHTTSCLQKLLNFPENIDVKNLIKKARVLQSLILSPGKEDIAVTIKSSAGHSLSPQSPIYTLPESYWEEQWRVLHKPEQVQTQSPSQSKSISKAKIILRTESDPLHKNSVTKIEPRSSMSSVRRDLLADFSREAVVIEESSEHQVTVDSDDLSMKTDYTKDSDGDNNLNVDCASEVSEKSSPPFSVKSSVGSNSCEDDLQATAETTCQDEQATCATMPPVNIVNNEPNSNNKNAQETPFNQKKPSISSKFQWLFKFSRNSNGGEESLDSQSSASLVNPSNKKDDNTDSSVSNTVTFDGKLEVVEDKKVLGTMKNLGQSMLENIQVIETVFQQEKSQQPAAGSLESLSNNILGSKGQATAMAAIKELRKISNLLSEM